MVLALLLAQLGWVLFTHLAGVNASRLFVWAPNDYATQYACEARVNGRLLTEEEFGERYRMPMRTALLEDRPQTLAHYLRRREQLHAGADRVQLTLRYQLNGHAPQVWRWEGP